MNNDLKQVVLQIMTPLESYIALILIQLYTKLNGVKLNGWVVPF